MSRCRAPWVAALLPLVTAGAALGAEPPAPGTTATRDDGVAQVRVELAGQFEKAIADCTRSWGGVPSDRQINLATSSALTAPPRVAKHVDIDYPGIENDGGNQAILLMVVLVDSLGNPRYAHVAREVSSNRGNSRFGPMAVIGLRHTAFKAATRDGMPVPAWWHMKVKFIIGQQGRMGNLLSEDKLNEFVAKARKGDADSQAVVAYLDSIAHEEVGIPSQDQYHFLAAAAANGERNALLTVTRLLGAPGCRPPAEVEEILLRFAMRGRSDLELLHATRMLERGSLDGHPEVGPMLHGAANSNDAFIQMWAAGMLATAPIEAERDPQAALESARTLKVDGDPDAGETLAAALAATGNYAEAVKVQSAAIKTAGRLHWNDAFMQQRLGKYEAGQPWVGWLCDCDLLVPEGGL